MPEAEQQRLKKQAEVMGKYSEILGERIAAFYEGNKMHIDWIDNMIHTRLGANGVELFYYLSNAIDEDLDEAMAAWEVEKKRLQF